MTYTDKDIEDFSTYFNKTISEETNLYELFKYWYKKYREVPATVINSSINRNLTIGLTKLMNGSEPDSLNKAEINALNEFDINWFEKLGYKK